VHIAHLKGVLSSLIESTVQQEFKEELIAFFFLWQNGQMVCCTIPSCFDHSLLAATICMAITAHVLQTDEQLDSTCELFLQSLNETVDFEVDDALDKLSNDSLIGVLRSSWADDHNQMYYACSIGLGLDHLSLHLIPYLIVLADP
jgi:hypothetical protein